MERLHLAWLLLLLAGLGAVRADPALLCSLAACSCAEAEVVCRGEATGSLQLGRASLAPDTYSLTVTDFGSVEVEPGTFGGSSSLSVIKFKMITKMKLGKFVFSEEESDAFLESFEMENINELELEEESFDNAPQCNKATLELVTMREVPSGGIKLHADTMVIRDCNFGTLNKESIYSDSMNFFFLSNSVGHVKTHGFSGSNNIFNFSNNYIEKMESNAISVAFLTGDISSNTFLSHTGTPLRDVGPEPVCMPVYSSYEDDAVPEYKKVASPAFSFRLNKFPKFSLSILTMPGTRNLPLGDLSIESNKVPCNCSLIRELSMVSDFEHAELGAGGEGREADTALMFKKLFYSTGVCFDSAGREWRLKRFARENLDVVESEDTGVISLACAA